MELEQKQLEGEVNEPFEIVHNARKNSKQLRAIPIKVRKNSTISLADEKQKKIKKKGRKMTESMNQDEKWMNSGRQQQQKRSGEQERGNWQSLMEWDSNVSRKQSIKPEQEGMINEKEQQVGFQFQDHQGEKCILEGIGDQNSLGRQFNFDFFNPEKFNG